MEGSELDTRRGGVGHRRQALLMLKVSVGATLLVAAILLVYHVKSGTAKDEPAPLALAALLLLAPFAATLPVILVLLVYGAVADRRYASGRCARCGYEVGEVREAGGTRCPECGAVV